jgi:hypothetical protein
MVGQRLLCAMGVAAATCFSAVPPVAAEPVVWQFSGLVVGSGGPTDFLRYTINWGPAHIGVAHV